jgi:hypothetical protein
MSFGGQKFVSSESILGESFCPAGNLFLPAAVLRQLKRMG